ncbi:MAG: DUF2029 domain-containing protein, partial [Novosphingobium sp.]|nr:DUF2029 domain-containing protein [Novosphingobium sp.]
MKLSRVQLALGVLCVLFLVWTIASGVRPGAYTDYLAEWREVMAGHDPWRSSGDTPLNAYGPLFNALGLLAWTNPIAPKLLFASGYVAFVAWLILRTAPDRSPRRTHAVIALCLLNPFPWVEIAHFGFFDVLVGIACVGAVHATRRGGDRISGALVGVGILVKSLPAVLLPVLASGGRRLRPDLVGAAVVVA